VEDRVSSLGSPASSLAFEAMSKRPFGGGGLTEKVASDHALHVSFDANGKGILPGEVAIDVRLP
jgi:hypothetical protein